MDPNFRNEGRWIHESSTPPKVSRVRTTAQSQRFELPGIELASYEAEGVKRLAKQSYDTTSYKATSIQTDDTTSYGIKIQLGHLFTGNKMSYGIIFICYLLLFYCLIGFTRRLLILHTT
jgi:hypothetical protein